MNAYRELPQVEPRRDPRAVDELWRDWVTGAFIFSASLVYAPFPTAWLHRKWLPAWSSHVLAVTTLVGWIGVLVVVPSLWTLYKLYWAPRPPVPEIEPPR